MPYFNLRDRRDPSWFMRFADGKFRCCLQTLSSRPTELQRGWLEQFEIICKPIITYQVLMRDILAKRVITQFIIVFSFDRLPTLRRLCYAILAIEENETILYEYCKAFALYSEFNCFAKQHLVGSWDSNTVDGWWDAYKAYFRNSHHLEDRDIIRTLTIFAKSQEMSVVYQYFTRFVVEQINQSENAYQRITLTTGPEYAEDIVSRQNIIFEDYPHFVRNLLDTLNLRFESSEHVRHQYLRGYTRPAVQHGLLYL